MNFSRVPCRLASLSAACIVSVVPACFAESSPIVSDDLARLHVIEEIDVSSDGSRVVCVVHGGEWSEQSKQWHDSRRLVLLDLVHPDHPPVPLTTGHRRDVGAAFAPRGDRIAFLRLVEGAELQVHVQPVSGGEPLPMAFIPGGVDARDGVAWSPDGRWLLVTGRQTETIASEDPAEQGSLLERLNANVAAGDPRLERPDDGRAFAGEAHVRSTIYLVDAYDPRGPVRALTSQPAREGIFMPDGESILCTWSLPVNPEPGRSLPTVIARIHLDGDLDTEVIVADPDWDLSQPRIGPEGAVAAIRGRSRFGSLLEPDRLGVADLSATSALPHWLTGDSGTDDPILEFDWRHGTKRLLFTMPDDGGIDLVTLSPTLLTGPRVLVESAFDLPVGVGSFASGGGVIAFARTSVDAPSELWVLDASGAQRRWNPNPWLSERDLVIPESGWASPKGELPIPWWLFKPTGDEDQGDVPLVILFPPGPGSMWGPGVLECWFRSQWLASRGWAVLYSNPRGSSGYGRDELRRVFRDPVRGPSRDMLWSMESMRDGSPGIGRVKRAVIGSSYGAMAAVWTVASDDCNAVILENGVFHVPTHIAQHDDWETLVELLGGLPQDSVVNQTMAESDLLAHLEHVDSSVLLITMGETTVDEVESDLLYRLLALSYKDVERVRYTPRPGGPTLHQRLDETDRIELYLRARLDSPPETP